MSAPTRPYQMKARAAAAEEATQRILDSAEQLFWDDPTTPVTLGAVADLADVSVHSILRRFGSQDGMVEAAARRAVERETAQRDDAIPGDVASAVRAIVDHYEAMGDRVLRTLSAEAQSEALAELVEHGRELHADWCRRFFAPALAERRGADRRRLLAQVIAICDVYTWMLLRRQRGLSRAETERALTEMLEPLVERRRD